MSNGKIVQIIGAVVDVEFSRDAMPRVFEALKMQSPELTLEVQQQLGDGVVRTIAMGSTDGLRRGMEVLSTGNPIMVPVGQKTLGRIMNVLGEPVDEAGPIGAESTMPIHRKASAKNPPDCCQMWDQWLGEFVGLNALEDVTDRVKSWRHYASNVPSAWRALSVNGRIFALPLSITTEAIYVRTDRIKEYGPKMPDENWTWDDFLALAKCLTKSDKNQYGYGMRGAGKWAVSYATAFLYGSGAQVLKDGKVAINSPEAVAGLDWYLDLFRRWKVTPASVPTDGYRQIVQGFSRGITNMYMPNSGSVEEQKRSPGIGAEKFTTLPVPIGPAKTRAAFYFCETLVMFQASKNKDAVWKFISWMLEDEPHYQFCSVAGNLPTRPALSQCAPFSEAPYSGFTKSFPFATVSPYLAYGSDARDDCVLAAIACAGSIAAAKRRIGSPPPKPATR